MESLLTSRPTPDAKYDSTAASAGIVATTPPLDEVHGAYRIRYARTDADREAAFRLRFEIFNQELGEGLATAYDTGLDRDPFDRVCDHLLVEDLASRSVIGTYRLQVAEMASQAHGFYSAQEFDLSPLADHLDLAVELGRACVAKEHRNRPVLFLLWRGLGAYLLHHRRRYFFGCSSLTSQEPRDGVSLYESLERRGLVMPTPHVQPKPEMVCSIPDDEARSDVRVPPLFATYLRHGAVVCGPPAIDRDFKTIDFLTLLDHRKMSPRHFNAFTRDLPGAPA